MFKIRIIIAAVILMSFLAVIVHADMISVSPLDNGKSDSQVVYDFRDNQYKHLYDSIDLSGVNNLYPLPGLFLQVTDVDTGEVPQDQNIIELNNEPSSFSLCLSALLGMSFYGSVYWFKKHSLGFIPEWYHSGGPHQIGHSFAVTPDFISTAPVICIIEPIYTADDFIPQYHQRAVISLWRESQFTPEQIASRGPPLS